MFPKYHIFFGFIFSLILHLFFSQVNLFAALIIFLSSFLIDIDHYLFFIMNKKEKNFIRAYKKAMLSKKKYYKLSKKQRKINQGYYIFHGIEFLIILFLLGFFIHKFFYFILLGCVFHLFLDYLEVFTQYQKKRKLSLIFDYFDFKKSNKPLKNKVS